MPYSKCGRCGVSFFGSNDGSTPKEKILCGECFNKTRGLTRSQF